MVTATASQLAAAFAIVRLLGNFIRHVTPLSALPTRILELLDLSRTFAPNWPRIEESQNHFGEWTAGSHNKARGR